MAENKDDTLFTVKDSLELEPPALEVIRLTANGAVSFPNGWRLGFKAIYWNPIMIFTGIIRAWWGRIWHS